LAATARIRYPAAVSSDLFQRFRFVARLEGTSFLVLLFLAMPLKYLADMPLAVRVVGSVHGLLFVVYVAVIVKLAVRGTLSIGRAAEAFALGFVPFGNFVLEARLKQELPVAER